MLLTRNTSSCSLAYTQIVDGEYSFLRIFPNCLLPLPRYIQILSAFCRRLLSGKRAATVSPVCLITRLFTPHQPIVRLKEAIQVIKIYRFTSLSSVGKRSFSVHHNNSVLPIYIMRGKYISCYRVWFFRISYVVNNNRDRISVTGNVQNIGFFRLSPGNHSRCVKKCRGTSWFTFREQ